MKSSSVVHFEMPAKDKKWVGGWTNLLRTQLQEFKPLYMIPDYSSKYGGQYANS